MDFGDWLLGKVWLRKDDRMSYRKNGAGIDGLSMVGCDNFARRGLVFHNCDSVEPDVCCQNLVVRFDELGVGMGKRYNLEGQIFVVKIVNLEIEGSFADLRVISLVGSDMGCF